MFPIIIFAVLAAILFVGSFISKRRFGLLGLALTAGATLSTIWTYEAGLVVSSLGMLPESVLTQAGVQSFVVLLPALLLLFHGQAYKNVTARVIGSLLFTLLALAFLVEPIGYGLPLEGIGATVYGTLKEYKDLIISIGVIAAVVDLFFTKPARPIEKDSKKH